MGSATGGTDSRRWAWGALTVVLLFFSGCLAGPGGARAASQPPGRSAPDAPTPTEPLREETVYDAQQLAELPDKHTVGVLNARGLGDVALSHLDGFDQLRSLTLAGGHPASRKRAALPGKAGLPRGDAARPQGAP